MSRTVDYYFSIVSPWAFLGHGPFIDVARRHQLAVTYRPVKLGEVFAETGGLPLGKRHPARQRYRLLELQRWRVRRGIDFHLAPAFWPFSATLADTVVLATAAAGHDPEALVRRLFSGVWQRQENIADPAAVRAAVVEVGLPADLADVTDDAAALYIANGAKAVAAGVFGSPSYVLDGEVFWGQDRIDLLDDALSSGRAPFTSAV